MANTLTVDIVDMTVPPLRPVRIAIVSKPNPVTAEPVTGEQLLQLIQFPKYKITETATGKVVNGGNIYDITPSQKKEKGLEEYLRDQQLRNLTNEKRYNENFEKMYSEKKIEKKAKSIVQNIQNRNVIGGNI